MNIIGKASIEIMKSSPFDRTVLEMSNLDMKEVNVELTPIEARCSQCLLEFANDDAVEEKEILMIAPITANLKLKNQWTINPNKMFFVHKACLEEFISTYLNPPSDKEREEEVQVIDMDDVVNNRA